MHAGRIWVSNSGVQEKTKQDPVWKQEHWCLYKAVTKKKHSGIRGWEAVGAQGPGEGAVLLPTCETSGSPRGGDWTEGGHREANCPSLSLPPRHPHPLSFSCGGSHRPPHTTPQSPPCCSRESQGHLGLGRGVGEKGRGEGQKRQEGHAKGRMRAPPHGYHRAQKH